MPPKRTPGTKKVKAYKTEAERKRWERANETAEETRQRLDKQRELQSASRNILSGSEKEAQLKTHRDDLSRYIHNLTDDRIDERLDRQREYQSNYIDSQTEEQTAERVDKQRDYQSNYIDSQTDEQTAERLDKHKEYLTSLREQETAEIHTSRLQDRVKLYTKSLNSKLALNFARSQTASEVSDNLVVEYSFGSMSFSCSFCDAKFWESEKLLASTKSCLKFSLCCGQSKVVLPPLATPPDLLLHLLTATDSRGKAFREHIRSYNTALGFASHGVNVDKELANAKKGVYTFRIHGMVHHSIGQLLPREGQPRAFAQIYIHDGTPEAELEYPQQHLGERSLPELRGLQDMMHNHNPFVSFFKHGIEVMAQHGAADIRMTIRAEGLPDPRRYNTPTASDIAVIMPEDGYTEHQASRDIHARNESSRMLQYISVTNCSYDPLHYVILFPRGENGWRLKISHNKGKGRITPLKFYY